jgi:chitin-binding protein
MRHLRPLWLAGLLVATAMIAGTVPLTALAHGYTTDPTSRAVWCRDAPGLTGDCGPVRYEPQSIEGPEGFPDNAATVPDGLICSAGNYHFRQVSEPRAPNGSPWPVTTIEPNSNYTYIWYLTAPHATSTFRVFLTRPGWDDTNPLTRDGLNLTPIASIDYGGSVPSRDVELQIHWPDLDPGHQVAVGVWDVADTANSFYQCADLMVMPE